MTITLPVLDHAGVLEAPESPMPGAAERNAIAAELRRAVRGEVRFSDGDRAMYASDAGNYRQVPIGVVLPRDAADVLATLEVARRHALPIGARGGGTGIPGQTVNRALMLDFSKYMNRIVALDSGGRSAQVEPGLVLDELRDAAGRFGLTFGPDPATHSRCTLGGMIGNNSCGIHSVMAGETVDNVDALRVVTYDGTVLDVGATDDTAYERIVRRGGRDAEIYRGLRALRDRHADLIRRSFPDIPRRVSGFNLPELLPEKGFNVARALVGTEATCVLVLQATVRLVPNPPVRSLLVLGYDDIFAAADDVVAPMEFGPIALEALDDAFFDDMRRKGMHPPHSDMMPAGGAWLLIEFGGSDKAEADAKAHRLMDALKQRTRPPSAKLFDNPAEERHVWHLREEGLGATAKVPGEPDNHEGWEDASVPPARLGGYLRDFKKLLDEYQYSGPLYGHFGQGCVHTRLDFDLITAAGIAKFRRFVYEAADLVVRYGGSLSGEHGDGQARGELLPRMYPPEIMEAFREFKLIWDPAWRMNPGKVIEPARVDEHLRLGTGFDLPEPTTHFAFPDDGFSFAEASERCVGAGVCRRHGGGTMCPSYMVTREEKHSTRGRARLLNEMLRADPLEGGWHSEAVREALDLCLSCKGCKGECPVQVDMATYKAEFLSHYYEGRLRPRTAYTMGRIERWARLASLAPELVNAATHAPLLATLARLGAGVHPARTIPRFAPDTFKSWFARRGRPAQKATRGPVLLWADTFNNFFHPSTAAAAVEVLEAAGFHVQVARRHLCCGRPLYDWGMLDAAKAHLVEILGALRKPIEAGVPIVVLEPSCASVFRDELHQFFPRHQDARRLREQTFLLSELLADHAPDYAPPPLKRKALLHGHCHHKAIMKLDAEEALLRRMGVELTVPDTGCCGMAGAFGFEREHYDVAMRCGERVLLPAVRETAGDTLVITDGFSCREQVEQATGRVPLHLAQVMRMALREGPSGPSGERPERDYLRLPRSRRANLRAGLLAGAGVALAGAAIGALAGRARSGRR